MTPEQKTLVRDSWEQIVPIADTAATLFYERLFKIDPQLRQLFAKVDMQVQRDKLIDALSAAVGSLDSLDDLCSLLMDLGTRHVAYGVREAHYDSVGAALVWTLEQGLGEGWNDELGAAWGQLYAFVSGAMRTGAAQARPGGEQNAA